jgi:hypothetical protein
VPAADEQPQLPAREVTGGTVLVRVKAAGLDAINNGQCPGPGTASEPRTPEVLAGPLLQLVQSP